MKESTEPAEKKENVFVKFYHDKYRELLIFPIILLILSFVIIGVHYAQTGDIVDKDISLKGGVLVNLVNETQYTSVEMAEFLNAQLPGKDVGVRTSSQLGRQTGLIVESSDVSSEDLVVAIEKKTGMLNKDQYLVEQTGSSLGASFFTETMKIILLSFLFMGITVLIYFRNFVPSLFVILCAFSNLIMPWATIVLLGVKLSTAGVAAFLMLIGYSVDTDILLTARVLKGKEGSVFQKTLGALKTGLTMTATAIAACIVAYFASNSETIKQIMFILIIGLIYDIFNTWITNAAILRWYMERKQRKA